MWCFARTPAFVPHARRGHTVQQAYGRGLRHARKIAFFIGMWNTITSVGCFEDNVVIDHDDYQTPDIQRMPTWVVLECAHRWSRNNALVEDCLFRRNRGRIRPEVSSGDPVGWAPSGQHGGGVCRGRIRWRGVLLKNLALEDNDDGGIYVSCPRLWMCRMLSCETMAAWDWAAWPPASTSQCVG